MRLPDGIVAIVKKDCPTCETTVPVLKQLASGTHPLTVYCQDDAAWPPGLKVTDDTSLQVSYELQIDTVPTLLRVEDGHITGKLEGWMRSQWEAFTGVTELGPGLPEYRPGCGSRTHDPDVQDELRVRYGAGKLKARRIEIGDLEDDIEAFYERGWTDGLPVVPPTQERVLRMLDGTTRDPQEIVAVVPPDLVECTVEKVAINAVMAGCRPEYLPVVLAAVEAACTDEFNMHGLLATTWFSGPVVVVNGPITRQIGMNSGINALGQGNRANATIGRALQLVVRNVGGGRPGEVDRATLGNPGKYTFCFPEDEEGSFWEPLATERGLAPGTNAVTLFAGEGVRGVVDQASRTPESLTRSLGAALRGVAHPKLVLAFDAMLVISPEHMRVFREAGWTKKRFREELEEVLKTPGSTLAAGGDGIAEGLPAAMKDVPSMPKFRPGIPLIVHAGGKAGLFSGIIGGWVSGAVGSEPVTREVGT